MFDALLGPIGHWELTRAAKRKTFLWMRPLVVVTALLTLVPAVFQTFPTGTVPAPEMASRWASFTPRFTVPTLYAMFAAATLSVPVIFAPLLAAERERRTLDVLLMTGQRAEHVVHGRWLAGLAQTLSIVAAPAPVLLAGSLYGGLDGPRIARVLLALAITVMTLSALTLLVSSFTRNLRETWAGLASILLLAQIGPESLSGIGQFLIRFELMAPEGLRWLMTGLEELRRQLHPLALLADEFSVTPVFEPLHPGGSAGSPSLIC